MYTFIMGLIYLSLYGSLYLYPLIAIGMAIYYIYCGSNRKPYFVHWCFAMALFSAAVYSFFLYVAWNWQEFGLSELPGLFGVPLGFYADGFAPIYSPLLCGVLLALLSGRLKARLSPEWEPVDIKRLIRLGVMAGHAALSFPIIHFMAW